MPHSTVLASLLSWLARLPSQVVFALALRRSPPGFFPLAATKTQNSILGVLVLALARLTRLPISPVFVERDEFKVGRWTGVRSKANTEHA